MNPSTDRSLCSLTEVQRSSRTLGTDCGSAGRGVRSDSHAPPRRRPCECRTAGDRSNALDRGCVAAAAIDRIPSPRSGRHATHRSAYRPEFVRREPRTQRAPFGHNRGRMADSSPPCFGGSPGAIRKESEVKLGTRLANRGFRRCQVIMPVHSVKFR